ncbi:MAG TPA: class I SAM-dependent methyltransferase [Chryseolinea sp.]|nr:class I SAM-dependent methyltransferase [Chryseolinea sp.]
MPTQESNWTHFWQTERHAFDDVMRMATQYFAQQFSKRYKLQGNVHVFDYGCGPGFLADALTSRGIAFSGADINPYFIDLCNEHHPEGNFFSIRSDASENGLILQQNLDKPADFIILLSITQYLASPGELEKIIVSLKPFLAPSGSIIVADVVDEGTRSYRDALSLLVHAARNGKLGAFLRFMRYVLRSEYARIAKTSRLQLISENFMREMCARQGFSGRREPGLTFHPTRKNYILQRHR